MNLKTLIVTVAVLGALSIAAFLLRRPTPPPVADVRLNQPLVSADTIEQAAVLRISDAGKTVELTRGADGTWRVPSYYDMPVDFTKLSGFVSNLTDARIQRLVTSSSERINRLDFKDTKIELIDRDGKVLFGTTLGKHADTGGGRFVRFGDEQKAFLTNLSAWLDTEPKNWANAELVNLKADDIARVEIALPEGGDVTVSRAKKEDPWTAENPPEGQKVKPERITSLVSSLTSVRFSDTTALDDPNFAAAKANLRTFKLTTFDGRSVSIALGRKPEEKKLKPLAPAADGRSGPAALGSVADLARKDSDSKAGEAKADDKPLAPEFETIPAGPVFAIVTPSEASAPVNALMQKRAVQISEYTFTSLPQKREDLFEATAAAHAGDGNAPAAQP